MNVKDIIEPLVLGWLNNSLTAPRSIKTDEAKLEEMDRLVDTVVRGAPGLDADGLEDWWETVVREHGARATTRSWPTPKELIDAMGAAREAMKITANHGARSTWALDPFKIAAGRIKRGEPVGETWVWGSDAVALVAKGYVTEAELSAYRTGLRDQLEDTYGESEAERIESENQARHANALAVQRGDNSWFQSGRGRGVVRMPQLRSMSEPARQPAYAEDFPDDTLDDDPTSELVEEVNTPISDARAPLSAEEQQQLFEARLRGDYGPEAQKIAEDQLARSVLTQDEDVP